jgi:tetratricopeptide (TPR) repeat protein
MISSADREMWPLNGVESSSAPILPELFMRTSVLLAALLVASPLCACLWDGDTLAQESAGLPDVKAIIVGGFPRNPPLYYEMRLERAAGLLKTRPDDLDAYDDAAVACDRLGRSDEAIEWMSKKAAALERMNYQPKAHAQPNHKYRYLANLGTFNAHRWFKNGAKRDAMDDLPRARDLIKQAIAENPDAHFGREEYQLRALEWVIQGEPFVPSKGAAADRWSKLPYETREKLALPGQLPNLLGITHQQAVRIHDDDSNLDKLGLKGAIEGLCGLIIMGNAWESVDVFYALAMALQTTGRSSFAYMAVLRVLALVDAGRNSIVPGAPTGRELRAAIEESETGIGLFADRLENRGSVVEAEYEVLKANAEKWTYARNEYLLAKLKAGEHPDTQPEFWKAFDGNPDRMEVPSGAFYMAASWFSSLQRGGWLALAIASVIPLAVLLYIADLIRRRRRRGAGLVEAAPQHRSFRLSK